MMELGGGGFKRGVGGMQHVLTLVASACDNMISHSDFQLACSMFRDQ